MESRFEVHGPAGLPLSRFLAVVSDREYACLAVRVMPVADTDLSALIDLGAVLAHWRSPSADALVFQREGAVVLAQLADESARITVAADSDGALEAAHEVVAERLQPAERAEGDVPVVFWNATSFGAEDTLKTVATQPWHRVRDTQPAGPREQLEHLVGLDEPGRGRLILWHGEPGTGKTYALRALVNAWREWCVPHYVTDPDELLDGGASYLLEVLTLDDPEHGERDWRLVILEDACELITVDAHERSAKALSRLLNTTDGFLGDNTIVLITTNEPIGSLHPAVTRPGRCLAEIEFSALSAAEANAWLAGRGSEVRVAQPTTIAECFALLDGSAQPRPAKRYGFAA